MAISVGVANPGNISGVSGAKNVGTIKSVGVDPAAAYYNKISPNSTGAIISRINNAGVTGASKPSSAPDPYGALLSSIKSSLAGLNQEVYAPELNLSQINAQARKAAEANVNPYYVKQLNDFLTQQKVAQQQQIAQNRMTRQNLADTLTNTLVGNEIQKQRTGEDVTQNINNINNQADQYQTDTGTQFANDRIAQAKATAAAGLTGGIGAQQAEAAQAARNTQESRQGAQFEAQKQIQAVSKARTFEDLARSGELATQAKEKGVKAANFDLNNFIQNQGYQNKTKKSELEAQRLGAVAQEQQNQAKLRVNNFISSISNPAQRNAALKAYGGLF